MNKKRKAIYDKTHGKCYYCGDDLPERWHADHVDPLYRNDTKERVESWGRKKGKDEIDNLVPACPRCNIRKSTLTVEGFRREIRKQVERLLRDSPQFRLALDYGLIKIKEKDVEFYFEQDI